MESESERSHTERNNFDLVIVGGGSAGYAAARVAAESGLRAALIESGREVGGLCILRGCMPSKTLLNTAEILHQTRQTAKWGIHAEDVNFDFAEVMARTHRLIEGFASERRVQLGAGKFTFIRDAATFLDPHTVALRTGKILKAEHFILTTGSTVAPPSVPGLAEAGFLTSDDVVNLKRLPASLIVLGAGAVAVELAQFFSRFGVHVTLLQRSGHILSDSDVDAADEMAKVLRREGVTILTGTKLTSAHLEGAVKTVRFEHEGGSRSVSAEEILFALGRVPNTDSLALEKAGVETERGRILTNQRMQTTVPHIYAAGDCTGPYEVVHLAVQQGEIAAHNIAQPGRPQEIDYRLLLKVIFTDPQLACVGLTEKAAHHRGVKYLAASHPFSEHGKAIIMEATDGFVKILASPESGEILGAACVGISGGELIHEIVVAMAAPMTVHQLAEVPHYHPTLAGIWTYPVHALAGQIPMNAKDNVA